MMNIRNLGLTSYTAIFEEMKEFTNFRKETTDDELWLLEHEPVYTQGQAGKADHILQQNHIPIVQSDRGGQVTYHGPGQLVGYTLMDLRRKNLGIRSLVSKLEKILIQVLLNYQIKGSIRCGAPGVYVEDKKIASIGLRVKNGCSYHGIALNVSMNLKPFLDINPCGFEKLQMTQMSEYVPNICFLDVRELFVSHFLQEFEV